jgi:hypothetical protein
VVTGLGCVLSELLAHGFCQYLYFCTSKADMRGGVYVGVLTERHVLFLLVQKYKC